MFILSIRVVFGLHTRRLPPIERSSQENGALQIVITGGRRPHNRSSSVKWARALDFQKVDRHDLAGAQRRALRTIARLCARRSLFCSRNAESNCGRSRRRRRLLNGRKLSSPIVGGREGLGRRAPNGTRKCANSPGRHPHAEPQTLAKKRRARRRPLSWALICVAFRRVAPPYCRRAHFRLSLVVFCLCSFSSACAVQKQKRLRWRSLALVGACWTRKKVDK